MNYNNSVSIMVVVLIAGSGLILLFDTIVGIIYPNIVVRFFHNFYYIVWGALVVESVRSVLDKKYEKTKKQAEHDNRGDG
jgi:hypothetical protein